MAAPQLKPGYRWPNNKVCDVTGRPVKATEARQAIYGDSMSNPDTLLRGSKGRQHIERSQWFGTWHSAPGTAGSSSSSWQGGFSATGTGDGWKLMEWDGVRYRVHYESGWYEVVEEEEQEDGGGGCRRHWRGEGG